MVKLELSDKIDIVPLGNSSNQPWVSGLCLLSPDTLLTADYFSSALRLVDLGRRKITSSLNLTSFPYDITCLPDSQAAVTLPLGNKIQIVSTNGGFSSVKDIKVSGECYGICYSNSKLVITYHKPGKLEMVSLDGTVYSRITTDSKGTTLFSFPCYLTALNTTRGNYLYFTDASTSSVTKLTMEEKIVSQFKDHSLSNLFEIVPIGNSHIAVCKRNRNITVICDKDGKLEIVKEWDVSSYGDGSVFRVQTL